MLRPARSLALILLLVPGCTRKSTYHPRQLGQEFRGNWIIGAEGQGFRPCGTAERWWVTADSFLQANPVVETTMVFMGPGATAPVVKVDSLSPALFTVLRGDTSPVGAYGPDHAYNRHLLVHEVGERGGRCP